VVLRIGAMAERHLTKAIAERLNGLSRKERVAKVRKLAGGSPEDDKFVRETFPDLYKEAFLSARRAGDGRSGAGQRRARSAGRR
jgi:hypothetical protein